MCSGRSQRFCRCPTDTGRAAGDNCRFALKSHLFEPPDWDHRFRRTSAAPLCARSVCLRVPLNNGTAPHVMNDHSVRFRSQGNFERPWSAGISVVNKRL
ncbi:hydroxyacyl-CoA dehydrogenase [Thauera aromatica K172]|uniref:Hydroxyacyl-CoA dehydrogenase n=1 Tax=Thauera aromatica K172 TaxID=44139 RepID=A0A2R4BNH5_THAAR|nr:hydroxyacyl-CoA dehydrogenase [Thauera aromatica K172]